MAQEAIVHPVEMPFAASALHADKNRQVSALGEDSFGEVAVMAMAVHSGSPLHRGGAGIGATVRIDAKPHIDEPPLAIPNVVLPSAVLARCSHDPGTEGVFQT